MANKKQSGEPSKANKFKFVYIEADLSETNFSDLTGTIAQVMRPAVQNPQVGNGRPQKQLAARPAPQEEDTQEALEAEYEETAEEQAPPAKRNATSKQKKSKPPTYLPDLITDFDAFKNFAKAKAPESKALQYLVAAYWLKEHGNCPTVNADKIYTCYKTAEWPSGFNDWNQTFHNLVHSEQMRKVGKGEFAINPTGEHDVKSLNS